MHSIMKCTRVVNTSPTIGSFNIVIETLLRYISLVVRVVSCVESTGFNGPHIRSLNWRNNSLWKSLDTLYYIVVDNISNNWVIKL